MEWVVRLLLAAIAVLLAYVSVGRTLAFTLRDTSPSQAYALSPGDGRIAAIVAQTMSGANATVADRRTADRLARAALRRDPTVAAAASTLGLNAQFRGEMAAGRDLLNYAQTLSRRDLPTQLWMIESAVSRGDVAGALHHYDIALRTWRNAPDILFPVLATAIADPAVQSALTRTLAKQPDWAGLFIEYIAGNAADPRAAASLLKGLRGSDVPITNVSQTLLINTLASRGLFDDAWSYYSSVRANASRDASRDPQFMAGIANPAVFDWSPINDAGIATSIQRGRDGGIFEFSAPASVGGLLLRQMQLLPPGEYRIAGHTALIDQPDQSLPYWALSCADGRELGRVAIPRSLQAKGVFVGDFTVPDGCPIQTLSLVARPSDAISGLAGQIDKVQLSPAR